MATLEEDSPEGSPIFPETRTKELATFNRLALLDEEPAEASPNVHPTNPCRREANLTFLWAKIDPLFDPFLTIFAPAWNWT
ncbi:hypothetical protein L596_001179 [Steinernema carpocapsae]|uniref:Uncharacterized protein n=1 Tax=Steinernema carpocapsae TaxID=34508 RepID=A0A4U8UPJ2_STECR|nr:hypothetical protein L596_001179 [Steinernema carpocapsae]